MEVIKLSKPYNFEGEECEELELDLDTLTGNDMIEAENKVKALGGTMAVPELSKQYQAMIAAKAAKVKVDFIMSLGAKDFSRVTMAVQNFLLDTE